MAAKSAGEMLIRRQEEEEEGERERPEAEPDQSNLIIVYSVLCIDIAMMQASC